MRADPERQRFEALAPALIEAIRRFLIRRTDPATADDVLSETLLVCWRRFSEMPADHLPWAYGVARLCLANAQRSHRRQTRLAARISVLDPPATVAVSPTLADDDLAIALAGLRAEDAEVLRLWAWEELTAGQIALTLNISPNAASIRLHRAKQRLREELGKLDRRAGHEHTSEGRRP